MMKIYYLKDEENYICGAQVIDAEGRCYELATNKSLEGLWLGDTQIEGTCDFDLNCSNSTARKRLKEVAVRYHWDDDTIIVSRKRLFD